MKVEEILKRDNNNIDLIRLVVAVMVLWSHSFPLTFGNGSGEWLGRFLKITYSGQLGVNIFFFISGLLVANSLIKKGSPAKFIISRFFRLMPALFFLLIITVFCVGPIVTTLPIGEYFRNAGTWKYFISNLFLNITYPLPGCFEKMFGLLMLTVLYGHYHWKLRVIYSFLVFLYCQKVTEKQLQSSLFLLLRYRSCREIIF